MSVMEHISQFGQRVVASDEGKAKVRKHRSVYGIVAWTTGGLRLAANAHRLQSELAPAYRHLA